MDSRIHRLEELEDALRTWQTLAQEGEDLISKMEHQLPLLKELVSYYSSPDWLIDYQSHSEGKLPKLSSSAVLSEDAVFDLLTTLTSLVQTAQQMNLQIARI